MNGIKRKLKRKLLAFRIVRFFTKFKPHEVIDPTYIIVDDDYNVVDFSNAILFYKCHYCGNDVGYTSHYKRHSMEKLKHCPKCGSGIDWSEYDEE